VEAAVRVGFVLQTEADQELPERVLGAACLNYLDLTNSQDVFSIAETMDPNPSQATPKPNGSAPPANQAAAQKGGAGGCRSGEAERVTRGATDNDRNDAPEDNLAGNSKLPPTRESSSSMAGGGTPSLVSSSPPSEKQKLASQAAVSSSTSGSLSPASDASGAGGSSSSVASPTSSTSSLQSAGGSASIASTPDGFLHSGGAGVALPTNVISSYSGVSASPQQTLVSSSSTPGYPSSQPGRGGPSVVPTDILASHAAGLHAPHGNVYAVDKSASVQSRALPLE